MRQFIITFSFLTVFLPTLLFGQSRIIVKDSVTGKTRELKKHKLVGLISVSNETVKYADRDAYPENSYWYLKSFTDTSLTMEFKRSSETKTYAFKKIKSISFKKNENTGSSVALAAGGLVLVIASPFIGINKDGYDFKQAGTAFGVGAGLLSIVYFTTRHKDVGNYTIIGTK